MYPQSLDDFAAHFNLLFNNHNILWSKQFIDCMLVFFFNIKKKILSNGTSYLGQKSGSTSLKYKNIKTERALLLNFVLLFAGGFSLTEFAECLVVEETLAMRKMVTLNNLILNIFVMLWKKLQQNKNWRENPQKLWHNCYWNVKISSSISYNCYVSLFYCLRIFVDECCSYLACNMDSLSLFKKLNNIDLILPNYCLFSYCTIVPWQLLSLLLLCLSL